MKSSEDSPAIISPHDPDAHLRLVEQAMRKRASDIHLDPLLDGYQIRYRVDGFLTPEQTLSREAGVRLVNQFKTASGIEPGTVFTPLGARHRLSIGDRDIDCRITLAPCISGPKMAIRLLDPERLRHRVTELGLRETGLKRFHNWLKTLNGMFLVTGPTASGKTTTLYALLHELASENRHIVSIEDPVEYEIDGINQIQVDHRHGLDFAEGLRTILRLDPDHAMIGELREAESAEAAVSAAISGHVILATMHSRDAVSAVTALRNFKLEDHQISSALGVVVNQRLVRRLCEECREESKLSASEKDWFERHRLRVPDRTWTAPGCSACEGAGYLGRTGLFEVWHVDKADYEMLLAGADEETLRRHLDAEGHTDLWEDAAAKIESGITTFDEVQRLGLSLPWE
ncbi:MAG: Flp pilus assembly complex ATPase component TadA [Verrucomicrobiae bacterium]|nr:Flp pilus assembly complex ATPase component TadA [Verrucomicrobiae bacterium]MCB1090067.1 Flp pilus assembly complex ATPase component TadA [Verrucomicrobiae bacterium]